MKKQVYISDTNIWIDLNQAGLLELLFDLPFTVCCTDFVISELKSIDSEKLKLKGLIVEALDESAIATLHGLMQAHNNSSLADLSCYQLAKQTGHALLTGDGQLRKQAQKDGVRVHGVIWLLDQMVAHKVVTPKMAAQGLQKMLDKGSRLPDVECQKRIAMWAR